MVRRAPPRAGEFVTSDEVASYALPFHKPCGGNGYTNKERHELCDCARTRFLGANMFRIWPDAEADALRWGANPPTPTELREVRSRAHQQEWEKFKALAKPDPVKDEP